MNFRLIKIFVLFSFLVLSLTGCASGQLGKSKTFKHNTPLIKEDIKKWTVLVVLFFLPVLFLLFLYPSKHNYKTLNILHNFNINFQKKKQKLP
jgi:hypothetical protein